MLSGKTKGIVAGIIIGATLSVGITGAVSTRNLYDVITDGVKIVVDGKELHPTDVNGKTVEPFIYNGTTYLPVRAVANAMNKAVSWDGENFTVYLGDMEGKLTYPTIELEKMTSIAESPYTTNGLTDNYENNYSRAICNNVNHKSLEYLLNMKYSRFKGTLYVPKGVNSDSSCYLTIEADGKTIYTSPKMTKSSRPVDIDVSVRGCNDIKIYFSNHSSKHSGGITACLADAGFYQ